MRQTNENLTSDDATKAMTLWLIAAARDKSVLTYGEAQRRLQDEVGFAQIARAGRTGHTAGAAIRKLLAVDKNAPLLNVLLVEQATQLPSGGAGDFLADRYNKPKLREKDAKTLYLELWRETFDKAAGEVYATPEERWRKLFEKAYGEPLAPAIIEKERARRKESKEQDGLRYGRTGEGPNHTALRLWVCENPGKVRRKFAKALTETEFVLESGDRVDALFTMADQIVAVEVKSRDSVLADLRRGVFQCIKYRAVLEAMDIRAPGAISAMLVTEPGACGDTLPGEIAALLKKHDIAHYQAPKDRP